MFPTIYNSKAKTFPIHYKQHSNFSQKQQWVINGDVLNATVPWL